MAKRRTSWDRVMDGIRVFRDSRDVYPSPYTDAKLDEVEKQLGSRLPHTYCEFMKRFGGGELQGWIGLRGLSSPKKSNERTVVGRTKFLRDYIAKHPTSYFSNNEWLSSLIYFAVDGGNNEIAWDPNAVTRTRPHECKFYYLYRLCEDKPVEAGDSFRAFVEWAIADIRSWRDPERLELDGDGLHFTLGRLRAKKAPKKADVRAWLASNYGAALTLAKLVKEQGRTEVLPILADALEEAGCTNADLLDSCRSGIPEDGIWAMQLLLPGK